MRTQDLGREAEMKKRGRKKKERKLKIFVCFHTYHNIASYYFDYTCMRHDQFNISLISQ